MNAKVPLLAHRASATVAEAVALLLISAAISNPAWAVTGGRPDGQGHPSVGAVIVCHPVYGVIPYFCGTLVHEKVLLTAGHGVALLETGEVTLLGVSFDPVVDLANGTWLSVASSVYGYGNYNTGAANPDRVDIGLLVLAAPAPSTIEPSLLPTPGFLNDLKKAGQLQAGPLGQTLAVVGYGWGLDWPPPEPLYPIIEGTATRNVAQTGYLALNAAWLITSKNLAAGYGGASNGDSGGPVFWTDPVTGAVTLVAITSWGGSQIGSGFYYRVDTVESLNFIADVIDGL